MPQNKNFARVGFNSSGSCDKVAGKLTSPDPTQIPLKNDEEMNRHDDSEGSSQFSMESLMGELGQLKLTISECPGTPNTTPYYVKYPQHSKFDQHEFFIGGMLSQIKSMPKEFREKLREIFKGYIFQMLHLRTGEIPTMDLFDNFKPTVPMHYLDEEEIYYYSLIPYLKQLTTNELLKTRVYTLRNFYRMLTFLTENHSAEQIRIFIQNYNPDPYIASLTPKKEAKKEPEKEPEKEKEKEKEKDKEKESQEVLRITPSLWTLLQDKSKTDLNAPGIFGIINEVLGDKFDFIKSGQNRDADGRAVEIDLSTGHIIFLDANVAPIKQKRVIVKDKSGTPKLFNYDEKTNAPSFSVDSLEVTKKESKVSQKTGSFISVDDDCSPKPPTNNFIVERCAIYNNEFPFAIEDKKDDNSELESEKRKYFNAELHRPASELDAKAKKYSIGISLDEQTKRSDTEKLIDKKTICYNTGMFEGKDKYDSGALLPSCQKTKEIGLSIRGNQSTSRFARQWRGPNDIVINARRHDLSHDFSESRKSMRLDPLTGRVIPGDKESKQTFYTRFVTRTYRVDASRSPVTPSVVRVDDKAPVLQKTHVVVHEERDCNDKVTTRKRSVSRFFTGLLGIGNLNGNTFYNRRHFKRQQ